MNRILIIEDDSSLAQGIGIALQKEGYEVSYGNTLKKARQQLEEQDFQLLILDVNLPDGNGLSFCNAFKKEQKTPVLMLTARDTEQDEIAGLTAGADDYITKPFSIGVLRARVKVLLRRTQSSGEHILGDCRFDFVKRIYLRGGKEIRLSKVEQRLLQLLVEHPGQTLTRDQIIMQVWDLEESVDENTLSVAIGRLRNKIGGTWIQTIYGIGYRWEKKV
ncbi:MAG: response regulator transcription factor [Lachnospiraceae bacterium]|nr:response regulator transcription factor [Lachnospiraceae bacterium]